VVTGDASLASQYADIAPADLVLVCGLFGNVTDADIEAMAGYCTQLCATGGAVIWTRGRWEPDLTPQVCAWFEERGFERVWLSDVGEPGGQRVGAHRFTGTPAPLTRDAVMFTFVGHNAAQGPARSRLPGLSGPAGPEDAVVGSAAPFGHLEQHARRVQMPRDRPDDPRWKVLRPARPPVPAALHPVQLHRMAAGRGPGHPRHRRVARLCWQFLDGGA
jgi:hypothetical protein